MSCMAMNEFSNEQNFPEGWSYWRLNCLDVDSVLHHITEVTFSSVPSRSACSYQICTISTTLDIDAGDMVTAFQ